MLSLKLNCHGFAALTALIGIVLIISLSLGACSNPDKEVVTKPDEQNLIPYRKGQKWGYSDVNKKIVIEPKYSSAEPFSDGLAKVEIIQKFGYIDEKGNEVIPVKYARNPKINSLSDGLVAIGDFSPHMGYMDKNGSVVIPFKYSRAEQFSEGLAEVCNTANSETNCGYIDKSGNEVIPLKYNFAEPFSEEMASVGIRDRKIPSKFKFGFIDKNGKEVIPIKYDFANSFSEGLAAAKLNGKFGFIDKNGKEMIPFKYENASPFSDGLAMVSRKDVAKLSRNEIQTTVKWGYIDKNGQEVIPIGKYTVISEFSEDLAAVILNGKLGYIDTKGNEVIPFKYKYGVVQTSNPLLYDKEYIFGSFINGLAAVTMDVDGKWGYIDKTGKEVIPFKYDKAFPFHPDGLAMVELNGEIGYIGRDGTEYFEP